jgi:biopolymer transport protein ExbD
MGFSIGGKRGIVSDPNVVPLIDILLVLLVIFMIIPHRRGLRVEVPQPSPDLPSSVRPTVVVVQVLADGSLRLNQEPVKWDELEFRLSEVFKVRADRTAFIRGDGSVEFAAVARVIDAMHTTGIAPIGLLTQDLGNGL